MKFGTAAQLATMAIFIESFALATECLADCAQNALSFAYAYGYPIYPYGLAVQGTSNPVVNTFFHQRDLANATNRWLVRPNADTVYSRAFLDVSSSDLEISVPEFGSRYWIWPFYDFYGNNVANIGSIDGNVAGKYLVRFDQTNIGVQTTGVKAPYHAYINLPTPYALSLARILVDSNPDDIETVRGLQDELSIKSVIRCQGPVAPSLNLSIFNDAAYMPGRENTLEQGVLKLTAKFAAFNQPTVPQDRSWVASLLRQAGIQNGTFVQVAGTNLTAASAAANSSASALLAQPGFLISVGGNWTVKNSNIIGDYGSYYQARYQIASVGYLALVHDEVIYPSYQYGTNSKIEAHQAILMTFGTKPKVRASGFWSLTAYDGDGYLIPNALNRSAIGDRSEMTFPDGRPLSNDNEDSMFQILVQPADISLPSNWTSNWLPAPEGGGVVSLNLRLYGAEPEMGNGSYGYPTVEVIDAITQ